MLDFFSKGIEVVHQAIKNDETKNYDIALSLYIRAVEYFITGLKYSKNQNVNNLVRTKVGEFLGRAELLKVHLKEIEKAKKQPLVSEPNHILSAEAKKLREALESTIVKEKSDVKMEDVAGLETAKQAFQEAVVLPAKFPQLFSGQRKPWNGILMYGPPGTGKTLLAKAVANASNSTFFSVSASSLISKWQGDSERLIKELFSMAIESKPSVVFIDEIDAIACTRRDDESDAGRRMKTELLVQMSRIADEKGVLVLAATNRPFDLDGAVRRRFERRIYIPLPDLAARMNLLLGQLKGESKEIGVNEIKNLAMQTDNYSGADMTILVREALMAPLREAVKSSTWVEMMHDGKKMVTPCSPNTRGAFNASLMDLQPDSILLPDVSMEHFENALKNTRPSVSKEEIALHTKFTEMYGESEHAIAVNAPIEPNVVRENLKNIKAEANPNINTYTNNVIAPVNNDNSNSAPKRMQTRSMTKAVAM